jgi:hypothetical protein
MRWAFLFAIFFYNGFLIFSKPPTEEVCALHGRVRQVQSHADYKVYVQHYQPAIRVQQVPNFPTKPGQWQFVPFGPYDFSISITRSKAEADFVVQYVDTLTARPGCK